MMDVKVDCPLIHEEGHNEHCPVCLGFGYRNLTSELVIAIEHSKSAVGKSVTYIIGAIILGVILPGAIGNGDQFLVLMLIISLVLVAAGMTVGDVRNSTRNLEALRVEHELARGAPEYQEFVEWKERRLDKLVDDDGEIVEQQFYDQNKRKRR